jgi:uncharacterized protein YigA (DUF484 family)
MNDVSNSTITAEEVVTYLSLHPEFFQNHLDLLEKMQIPHPSGSAVSLISKQLEIFRVKHQEQESQLSALIEIARENDASFNRMHELTLAMLEANSVDQVVANLSDVLAECFLTDFVAVKIIANEAEMYPSPYFVERNAEGLKYFEKELKSNQPKCGQPNFLQVQFLFGNVATEVRSSAIIPMVFTGLEGMIAIGSRDENRFHPSMGTLFLTQISEIIGTRLLSLLPDIK